MRKIKKPWMLVAIILVSAVAAFIVWRIWNRSHGKIRSEAGEPQLVVQLGHSSDVRAVAFSHDGKLVVTGSEDRTAVLWDAATGVEIRRFVGHEAGINVVAFSPDDRLLLTGSGQVEFGTDNASEPQSRDATARIWDVGTGREILRLEDTLGILNITSAAFSPDGKFVLAGVYVCEWCKEVSKEYAGGVVCLWNAVTGKKIRQFKGRSSLNGFGGAVAFSPDGRSALIGFEGDVGPQLLDIATGQVLRQFSGGGEGTFLPDGQHILTSNGRFFELETGDLVKKLATCPHGCAFSPDGRFAASTRSTLPDSGFAVRDVTTDQEVLTYDTPRNDKARPIPPSSAPVFSPDGKSILVGLENGTSHLWNLVPVGTGVSFEGQAASYGGRFLPDRHFLLTGNALWDMTTGQQFRRFSGGGAIAFSPNGDYAFRLRTRQDLEERDLGGGLKTRVIISQSDGTLIDFHTGTEIQQFKYEDPQFVGPMFSQDSKLILTGDEKRRISLWDVSTGKLIKLQGLEPGIGQPGIDSFEVMAVSPDGRYIFANSASASSYGLGLFSADSGTLIRGLTAQDNLDVPAMFAIAAVFSPDGRFVLSGSKAGYFNGLYRNGIAVLWDVVTGKEIRRFEGHSEEVSDVAFSPDGRFILTAGDDRFVILWDASTGKMIRKLESPLANGSSASFSSDGRFILTGSQDGAMAVWDFDSGQELCRLISFENGDWVVTAPDGRFDTNNLEHIAGLHWILGNDPLKPLPLEIFMRQYYEPRLLARVFAGEKLKPLPSLSQLNRTQPEVKITDIQPDSAETVQVTVEVATVKSEVQTSTLGFALESGVYDVRLFRDGQLVGYAPANDGKVALSFFGEKATLKFPNIRWPRTGVEQVEFSAYAFNSDRIKSATDRKTYKLTPLPARAKGRAYIISLGVNAYQRETLNLRYAANDARQVQESLTERLAAQGEYDEVVDLPLVSDYTVTLADGSTIASQDAVIIKAERNDLRDGQKHVTENNTTKAHLRSVLDVLAGRQADAALLKDIPNADKLRPARPEDLILISVSSHGYTDSDGIFYIVPSDTGTAPLSSSEFRSHCVSSDELSRWLRDVDAGDLVMIIDACHSSAAIEGTDFKPGPMGSRGLGQLSYDKGMRILTATQADNVAMETNKVRQGLLTYALLNDGLNSWQADYKPRDNQITLSEWLGYGVERVPHLYEEVKAGALQASDTEANLNGAARIIRDTVDPRESDSVRTQQPSLFDFARRRREVVLARKP
jgi:WD40 repeat protein